MLLSYYFLETIHLAQTIGPINPQRIPFNNNNYNNNNNNNNRNNNNNNNNDNNTNNINHNKLIKK